MADYRKKDWKNATLTTGDCVDVDSTQMLKEGAKMSSDQNESNPQKEYKKSGRGFSGPFGNKKN